MMNECPNCCCNDVERTGQVMQWGKWRDKWRCNHCGRSFTVAPDERASDLAVDYIVIQCPRCLSKKTRVTSTQKPIRYHKCDNCELTFKSVEKDN